MALGLLITSGCATMGTQILPKPDPNVNRARLVTIPQVYSGTVLNAKYFKAIFIGPMDEPDGGQSVHMCCIAPIYFPLDFPLSLLFDTLLLPLTITRQVLDGDLTIQCY